MKAAKTLWLRDEYLQLILEGCKTIEVRVGYSNIRRLKSGDELLLNEVHHYRIVRIAWYSSFEELLQTEDSHQIAPDLSHDRLMSAFREIYPPEKEALGVAALEITKAQEGN